MNIAIPVFFLILTILSFVWFGFAFRKKNLPTSTIINWLAINILFLILFTYLLILGIVKEFKPTFPYDSYNFFQWIAVNIFGINVAESVSWLILLFILMFVIMLTILINSLIKLNIQNKRINDLNRNLAILKGKVSIDMKELHFDTSELSAEELKHLLEEQLAKEKLKAKYKNKFIRLNKTSKVSNMVDTKTLLNISKDKKDQDNTKHH